MNKYGIFGLLCGLIVFGTSVLHAQKKDSLTHMDYSNIWSKIDSLERQRLTRSALQEVDSLYAHAQQAGETLQVVKALMYRLKYHSVIEENSDQENVDRLKAAIAEAQLPERQIFQSLLANVYQQYYQYNRWEIMSRTAMQSAPEDYQTWDASQFHKEISRLYLASLKPVEELQGLSLEDYEAILIKAQESARYRPTMYDILAHRALAYFTNTESGLTIPVDPFTLEEEQVLVNAKAFSELAFDSPDTLSQTRQAVGVLQELLQYHLNSRNTYALIDVDLARLKFLRAQTQGERKDSLYLQCLQELAETYKDHPACGEVYYEVAQLYREQGNHYAPLESDAHQWKLKEALKVCQQVISDFPDSRGAAQCRHLVAQIEQRSLSLSVEQVNLLNEPFRARLSYQNLNQVHFRVVTAPKMNRRRMNQEKLAQQLAQQNPLEAWSMQVPDAGDYQNHATEIRIPELKSGSYMLLASDDPTFSIAGHAVAFAFLQVSDLSYFYRNNKQGDLGMYVVNRESGQPLPGVSVQVFQYDYERDKWRKNGSTMKTGADGYLQPQLQNIRDFELEFSYKKDRLRTGRLYNYHYSPRPDLPYTRTFFFTDRKIYRPGQTIHFKAIVLRQQGETHEILAQRPVDVQLYDVNRQEVAKLSLKTNAYGTVSGSFTAPSGGVLGSMTLDAEGGSTTISVEEYKRPTFKVEFDPIADAYELGDTVSITGNAMAYAGNPIDGAEVQYRVVREARFPYWWGYGWRRPPSSPVREITNGQTQTKPDGTFEVSFTLAPDPNLDKQFKPLFTYRVIADVVDLTGETRTGERQVQASYVPLQVSLQLPEIIERENPGVLKIISENLSGKPQAIKGTLTVTQLQAPDIYRSRRWQQPDVYVINEASYRKDFPYDIYKAEHEVANWPLGAQVMKQAFDISESKDFPLSKLTNAAPGKYKVRLEAMEGEVEVVKFIDIVSSDMKAAPYPSVLFERLDKKKAEPGETVTLTLQTTEKKTWVHYILEKSGEVLDQEYVLLKKNKRHTISIPIKEEYRGNISVSLATVKHNEFHQKRHLITVPWSNKDLKLEWMSMRSELQPGDQEQWKLKISGPKTEKVAAEMVATLYDASLDAFRANDFYFSIYPSRGMGIFWQGRDGFGMQNSQLVSQGWNRIPRYPQNRTYDRLNTFGFLSYAYNAPGGLVRSFAANAPAADAMVMEAAPAAPMATAAPSRRSRAEADDIDAEIPEESKERIQDLRKSGISDEQIQSRLQQMEGENNGTNLDQVDIRTNLQETAFFFPQLETNAEGEVVLDFTIPEALTEWKFLGFAHTQDLEYGMLGGSTVTKKKLMVRPNVPRFFREKDEIILTAKVNNLTEDVMNGVAELRLLDAFTMEPIASDLGLGEAQQKFSAEAGQSTVLSWELDIPHGLQAVVTQFVARAGDYSDGEEHVIPVLSNRMLVTETLPLAVRGGETKEFTFDKLLASDTASTLAHQKLTLEFTSNPAWYAVQALPYLMEYPHECTEQIYSRYYANALASHIANSSPNVQRVFNQWKSLSRDETLNKQTLLSNLEKNQELKSVLLEETPWLLNARSETERKQRIGILFDLNRMAGELSRARNQLKERQLASGAFSWFPGMRESRYITQLIATGMGHLQKLGVHGGADPEISDIVGRSIPYLDKELQQDLNRLKRYKVNLDEDHLGSTQIQYLYMRSFYTDIEVGRGANEAFEYYYGQAKKYWTQKSTYMQGMLALVFHRYEDQELAEQLVKALKENAVFNEELGMYWKDNRAGYFWFEAPIERQALLVEAFDEVAGDHESVEEMKIWLLKNKQTNDWETTRATVAACNALLQTGSDWLDRDDLAQISLGGELIDPKTRPDMQVEAGTGYVKTAWTKEEIKADMGKVTVEKPEEGIAWGAVYWQYFEQMDKITFAETPLSIQKELFKEILTESGPELEPISASSELTPGDKVKVRIEIRVDRDMEYVHLKDMRASGFEPINVLSQYKYQGGLGYYESTRDAATNFFIEFLPKGTYVFEYPLRATLAGDFSNGITTIQCMYAPEFTSHSEGIRVKIGE